MTSTATTLTATCGHQSDVPAQLCPACTTRLRTHLDQLPGLYTLLAAWLTPGSRQPGYSGSKTIEAPLPLREHVLDLRGPGGIVGVLEDWHAAIADARGFTTPSRAGSIPARIGRAVTALQANLPWISLTWEQGTALAAEIRKLHGQCHATIEPRDASTPIGQCPSDLGDGQICGQTIRVPKGTQTVHCHSCGTTYPPNTWLNLRRWMDNDLTAA
jgi:hypothetical protein